MRRSLALTASLTGGSAAVASAVFAAEPVLAVSPAAMAEVEDAATDNGEKDKTGLWGLLGLAGLAKKKERVETTSTGTTRR